MMRRAFGAVPLVVVLAGPIPPADLTLVGGPLRQHLFRRLARSGDGRR